MNRRNNIIVTVATLLVGLLANPCAAIAQHAYSSPEAAAEAFTDALATSDEIAMGKVLGNDWRRFVPTEGIGRDDVNRFLSAWAHSHRIVRGGDDRALLAVGNEDWTLPIPLIKSGEGWRFDPRGGVDEMRTRRIGRNELHAMQSALAYYDAQKEYARLDRDSDSVLQYAQKFVSTPGKHDGLYWTVNEGEAQSPLGPLFASTEAKTGQGYHGYRYKILKGQGGAAPGGAYSYLIKGRMVSGFGLVAWPVRYGDTGVMSFLLSHDGQLYQKDLGPNSAAIAGAMTRFDPDASWKKVDDAI
ncbi:MAG TPA: DUF2950 domain-containing protein [Burkholderiales bacterium]|nr:DUF2950 domain-containing protein [Burkholderiales bacterium]